MFTIWSPGIFQIRYQANTQQQNEKLKKFLIFQCKCERILLSHVKSHVEMCKPACTFLCITCLPPTKASYVISFSTYLTLIQSHAILYFWCAQCYCGCVPGSKTEGGSGSLEWKHANSNQAATDNTLLSTVSVSLCSCMCLLLLLTTVAIAGVNNQL